jgi:hypothetical protein
MQKGCERLNSLKVWKLSKVTIPRTEGECAVGDIEIQLEPAIRR